MMKNITFIITDITKMAGTERTTVMLCNVLAAKGYAVEIISIFRENKKPAFEPDASVKVDYVLNFPYAIALGIFKRMKHLLLACKGLRSLLRKKDSDFIIAQCFLPALFVWLSGKAGKGIVCEHFKYDLYSPLVCWLRDSIYSRFCCVVLLTDQEKAKYTKKIKHIEVIPNIAPFAGTTERADLNSKRIIAAGRLSYQKGYDLLLEAAKKIFKDHPDWKLDIYGEGELREQLFQLCGKNGVQNFVTFKGRTISLHHEMLQSSVFVLSSRYEGMPMVLLEAMGCGLPVVSFDCPTGPARLLANDRGCLVEAENTDGLADGILRLIKDNKLREHYARQGLEKIKEFSPEVISQEWSELFYKTNPA